EIVQPHVALVIEMRLAEPGKNEHAAVRRVVDGRMEPAAPRRLPGAGLQLRPVDAVPERERPGVAAGSAEHHHAVARRVVHGACTRAWRGCWIGRADLGPTRRLSELERPRGL